MIIYTGCAASAAAVLVGSNNDDAAATAGIALCAMAAWTAVRNAATARRTLGIIGKKRPYTQRPYKQLLGDRQAWEPVCKKHIFPSASDLSASSSPRQADDKQQRCVAKFQNRKFIW